MSRAGLRAAALLVACGGGPPRAPSPGDFKALHAPLYAKAGAAAEPSELHAHLAARLAGPALTRAYREQRALSRRAEREGTVVDVDELRYLRVEPTEAPPGAPAGLAWLRAEWTVTGTVRHQGHAHQRSNRYVADFGLRETDAGWRIVEQRARALDRVAAAGGGEAWGADGRPRAAQPLDPWALLEAEEAAP